MTLAYTLFVVAVFAVMLGAVRLLVWAERRNSSPERHARMAARWEDATGMTYPDREGRSAPLYDWSKEDAA